MTDNPYDAILDQCVSGQVCENPVEVQNHGVTLINPENDQFEAPNNEGDAVFVDSEVPAPVPQIPDHPILTNSVETPLIISSTEIETRSENGVTEYSIYESGSTNMTTESWESIPNDPSQFVKYWASPSSFSSYNANSQENNQLNSPFFGRGFLINLLIGFILMCCVTSKANGNTPLAIFVTFLVVLATLVVYLVNHYFFPKLFIEYGLLITLAFNLLCVFLLMIFSVWYWIAPFIGFCVLGIVFYFASRGKDEINGKIFNILNSILFTRPVTIVFYA